MLKIRTPFSISPTSLSGPLSAPSGKWVSVRAGRRATPASPLQPRAGPQVCLVRETITNAILPGFDRMDSHPWDNDPARPGATPASPAARVARYRHRCAG